MAARTEADPQNATNIQNFIKEGFKCLVEGISQANGLPTERHWNFYTTFDSFNSHMNKESNQLLDVMTAVLKKNEVSSNIKNQSINTKTEIIIEANDAILERVANNIDEMNGIKKDVGPAAVLQTVSAEIPININGSWNRVTSAVNTVVTSGIRTTPRNSQTIRLLTAENIIRPQSFFKDKIDNRNDYPWEPKIKDKPNSLKPLAIFLEETENGTEYSHPYEYELDRFTPSDQCLKKAEAVIPKPLTETPLIEINTPNQLPELLEELRTCKEIAIDLEHHSYRTFMGLTCLMQISTREKDYLIDTLALRSDLWILNEVFTRPDILKIFHGADSDIVWLQRDLSLYIVNMFDTSIAARDLEYSRKSLAYLMQRFCNFLPDKQFQLADWRIRPLPNELKKYAREDTHYLIYIYEMMRNELIDKSHGQVNLLKAVYDKSTILCKKKYFKPHWHENSHLEFYSRCHRMFDNRQLFALKEIYKWRDNIARIEDESVGYVLPNNMMLEIAGRLPKEMQGILACCSPVPPLVRANLLEIHKILLKALEQPFEEPILKEDTRARGSAKQTVAINIDGPLHCPHDLKKDIRDDLPTLINSIKINVKIEFPDTSAIEQGTSVCSVFDVASEQSLSKIEKLRKFKENFKYRSPFERYQLVKPFIQAREKKAAEERAKEREQEDARKQAEKSEDNGPTDEQRIESIKQHYLHLRSEDSLAQSSSQKTNTEPKTETANSILDGNDDLQTNRDSCEQLVEIEERTPNKRKRKNESPNTKNSKMPKKNQQNKRNANKNRQPQMNNASGMKVKQAAATTSTEPSNSNFVPYDYSMVDFRQFQGGGKGIDNTRQIKLKYKMKGPRGNQRGKFGIGKVNKR